MWSKLKTFALMPFPIKWLVFEAIVFLGWARFLKALPFSNVVPSLGTNMVDTPLTFRPADEAVIKRISQVIRRISPYTLWESKCLVMAIAGQKMLARRGIESTLYLGTSKDPEGKMIAHAWLRSGPFYVTGAEVMKRFGVVAKFGKRLDSLSAELMLILDVLRMGNQLEEEYCCHEGIDWERFLILVNHHRVYPILAKIQKQKNVSGMPRNISESLHRTYIQNTFQMLQLTSEMGQVCHTLHDHGIQSIVLKGPVLANALYGDLSLRTSKDLDILIPEAEIDHAERVLEDLGYVSDLEKLRSLGGLKWTTYHLSFTHPQKKVQIEVHWRLNTAVEPDFNELWERRNFMTVAGYPVHYLGNEDLFVYLVSHGARHGWFRLRWLMDIDQMIRRSVLNTEALHPLLKKYRCTHLSGQSLILAARLFHTPIPEEITSYTKSARANQLAKNAYKIIRDLVPADPMPTCDDIYKQYRNYFFSTRSFRQILIYYLGKLYPNTLDAQTMPLPKPFRFLYFPLRPFLWAWRRIMQVSKTHV